MLVMVRRYIATVTAQDSDGQGVMMYDVIGFGSVPSFFYVGNNGQIYSLGILRPDRDMEYTLRVVAQDSTTTYQRATADVAISVLRNVNGPIFNPDSYTRTISEDTDVGTSILRVTATDTDNDHLTFILVDDFNSECRERDTFYIREDTGDIFIGRNLLNTGVASFSCRVQANDNGYPNDKSSITSVTIFVSRDNVAPIFTQNARYLVIINENEAIDSSIIRVSAYRQGLSVSPLKFRLDGTLPVRCIGVKVSSGYARVIAFSEAAEALYEANSSIEISGVYSKKWKNKSQLNISRSSECQFIQGSDVDVDVDQNDVDYFLTDGDFAIESREKVQDLLLDGIYEAISYDACTNEACHKKKLVDCICPICQGDISTWTYRFTIAFLVSKQRWGY